ncbi:MAG: hypothetical protein L0191_21630 [Acidobacteria bacterium]|nr:hypothetical protein [Acidobacteriota bacterium]
MRLLVFGSAILFVAASLAPTLEGSGDISREARANESSQRIVFRVGSDATSQMLGNVDVLLVGRNSRLMKVGSTNELGMVTLEKRMLLNVRDGAVLFCKEFHFCGAFIIKDLDLVRFDEALINLAPFALH